MKAKARSWHGSFVARPLGAGTWQLSSAATDGPEIYLTGAESAAAAILQDSSCNVVTVEWREGAVVATVAGGAGARIVRARNAVIHEPLGRLYATLPLAPFDDAARRFWRRVFLLVRVPGGRHLLSYIARRTRTQK
jgi:hypothetical protein